MSILKIRDENGQIIEIPVLKGDKGDKGDVGPQGEKGTDGYSPTANVTQTDSGATITITDKDGTTTATVVNGKDGKDAVVEDTDPNRHAEYFDITDDGELTLKPEYRGATTDATLTNSISDMGVGVIGSLNAELPANLIIPEVVNEIAVDRFSSGMLFDNRAIESLTFPITVDEIPEQFAHHAVNLRNIINTEHIKVVGYRAFRNCRIEKVIMPNLETLSGAGAFTNNPHLIYADIGKVSDIPSVTFGVNLALSKITTHSEVKSVGQQAFYNTPRLVNADFLGSLTSIGKGGFWRSGIDYDWSSLKGCTFADYATPLQANPTDFWSGLAPVPCENPLPTKFAQKDYRWVDIPIGTSGKYYGADGCGMFCIAHIYCGFNNLVLTHISEFEAIVNAFNPNLINTYIGTMSNIASVLNGIGLTATHIPKTTGWNAQNLGDLYATLNNGGYAIVTVGTPTGHAITVYGVTDKKELLYIDSAKNYWYDTTKYTLGKLPYEKLLAQGTEFILVTR